MMLFNCEEDKERYITELEKDRDIYSKEWREACLRLAAKNHQNKELEKENKRLWEYINGTRPTLIINEEFRVLELQAKNAEMREALRTLARFSSHRATDATASQALLDAMVIAKKYTEEK